MGANVLHLSFPGRRLRSRKVLNIFLADPLLKGDSQMEEQEDHVWRFALGGRANRAGYEDPLVEMVRAFLEDFLSIGYLTNGGRKVGIDGFTFLNEPEEHYRVFLDNAESTLGASPMSPSPGTPVDSVQGRGREEVL